MKSNYSRKVAANPDIGKINCNQTNIKMKKNLIYILTLGLLSACTSVDTALPMGNNTYEVSSESGPISISKEDLINQTIESANQTCLMSGKTIQVLSKNVSNSGNLFGNNLKATVTFKCN